MLSILYRKSRSFYPLSKHLGSGPAGINTDRNLSQTKYETKIIVTRSLGRLLVLNTLMQTSRLRSVVKSRAFIQTCTRQMGPSCA